METRHVCRDAQESTSVFENELYTHLRSRACSQYVGLVKSTYESTRLHAHSRNRIADGFLAVTRTH